MAHVD
jgi:hypothetical protein